MDSTSRLHLDLRQATLPNGLRVVLHRDPTLPLVSQSLWYHVGSKHERPGHTGLAHLFEHMLFQGSEHVGTNDHFRHLQQAGGVGNGSTWFDRTNYYCTLPSQHLELGLWLESDRMGWLLPALTQEKLDNQREVVMNERRQRFDNQPYGRAFERLHELLYPEDHPYRWPVIGYLDDIAKATLADAQQFFATWYVPGNAVLTLAGDFDESRALELVESYFGPVPAGPPPPPPRVPQARLEGERREIMPDRVQLERLYMGFVIPPFGHDDWYAADFFTTALTAGKSSLLYEDLVYRRQLAQDVSFYALPTEEAATLLLTATAKPGVEIAALEAAIDEHLRHFGQGPLPQQHLERARRQLLTDHFQQLQTLERRADLLSHFTTFFGDPARLEDEPARFETLDAEAVMRFAACYCRPEHRAVVVVVPDGEAA
jgi:zinc protease